MKRKIKAARTMESAAGLDRLKHLEDELASVPALSRRARQLSAAIRVEADAYRKSLDVEQATATHDAYPLADVGRPRGVNRPEVRRPPGQTNPTRQFLERHTEWRRLIPRQ
jgi:hypothetical protein